MLSHCSIHLKHRALTPRRQPYWYHPRVVPLSVLGQFPVAAARAWNALPQHVRNVPSLSVFRRELKTVLFRSSFHLTMYCAYLRPSLSAHLSPCTGCYKLIDIVRWSCSSSAIMPPQ